MGYVLPLFSQREPCVLAIPFMYWCCLIFIWADVDVYISDLVILFSETSNSFPSMSRMMFESLAYALNLVSHMIFVSFREVFDLHLMRYCSLTLLLCYGMLVRLALTHASS